MIEKLKKIEPKLKSKFYFDYDMSKSTWFRTGGKAKAFALVDNYKELDAIICVSAPMKIRIERVVERDKSTQNKVMKIMNNQMKQVDKEKLSDFIILNDGKARLLPQALDILDKIHHL